MFVEEFDQSEELLKILSQYIDGSTSEIQVFDCQLHGNSQPLIYHSERQVYIPESEEGSNPCGVHCYLQLKDEQKVFKAIAKWKPLEKELYLKGVEIFGKKSCFIARNLLSGLKTCIEVFTYMNDDLAAGSVLGNNEDGERPSRPRSLGKRGKARKPTGHSGIWRRIANGKDPSRQYTPCECDSQCGKNCSCVKSRTYCEKYCGCEKSCINRFTGCRCAKSQCRTRLCACFAANQECDPDVCQNCWVSCGDGTLGETPRRGDGQCGNMRLLLGQHQKILLGKSDVDGWGAFLTNPVDKNVLLGEYTGELISHKEADKRGKIYDHANSSFLFDLNGHIILVAGDHRVGIFSKEPMEAGEEIFCDYHYTESTPVWAQKLEEMKGDEPRPLSLKADQRTTHQSQK